MHRRAHSIDDGRWAARAARARRLADERPALAETLRFYATLAETQEELPRTHPHVIRAGAIDEDAAADAVMPFLDALRRELPAAAAESFASLQDTPRDAWRTLLERYWRSGGREAPDADDRHAFVVEALLQPFAESIALDSSIEPPAESIQNGSSEHRCPHCTGTPVVALLREASHGARRSLVCGLCLTEWPAGRLRCVTCGETRFEHLPVFRADEFSTARIDACDACRTYIKTIDLTRDGAAMPIADDLATLPLDLWAREQGYRRARPNVLRL